MYAKQIVIVRKNLKKVLKWVIYYPLLVAICLELALLILGYRRYQDEPYSVIAVPENAFIGDDSLGIYLNPGHYEITLNEHIHFNTEHLNDNRRLTPHKGDQNKPKVAFLGCSFTYGYGVNNEETFVAQLQNDFPTYSFENHGVVGYGTVQALLELPKIIKDTAVQTVILDFSSFHFMRNVLSESYRRNLKIGYSNSNEKVDNLMAEARFPYFSACSDSICFANWRDLHTDWYGRRWFATINWIQTLNERFTDHKQDDVGITTCIIQKMANICAAANVTFALVCLDKSEKSEELHANLTEIDWMDVNFDFGDSTLTLLPYDSHPSAAGHAAIARKIKPFLTQVLGNE